MTSTLVQLFRHNVWANLRLFDACRDLTGAQLDAPAPGGVFGNIYATLYHIVINEENYLNLLAGHPLQDGGARPDPLPGVDELRARIRQSGEGLIQTVGELPEGHVFQGIWQGEPYSMPAAVPIIQAINHATEHRAQIAALLTQMGIQPPSMDGWTFGDDGIQE